MAISSQSKLRETLADERAVAVIDEYLPGFTNDTASMGPCMGMKIGMLLKFPQVGLDKETTAKIIAALDALDA